MAPDFVTGCLTLFGSREHRRHGRIKSLHAAASRPHRLQHLAKWALLRVANSSTIPSFDRIVVLFGILFGRMGVLFRVTNSCTIPSFGHKAVLSGNSVPVPPLAVHHHGGVPEGALYTCPPAMACSMAHI